MCMSRVPFMVALKQGLPMGCAQGGPEEMGAGAVTMLAKEGR